MYDSIFMILLLSISTLFPYTTLFRSHSLAVRNLSRKRSRGSNRAQIFPSRLEIPRAHGTLHRLGRGTPPHPAPARSEEHTSELQSRFDLVCRLLLEKKKKLYINRISR